ncbi:NAD(P)-binding protein [Ascodesmis nigricans]|uniref:NAD(P)-binding protein n=1 Tax=Ascodesmis nigricans TaxID=341454 RepID=A0A4S2MU06_9PEZI|nr:NAD(P)-binding protein [Ascodesmis nigricans]
MTSPRPLLVVVGGSGFLGTRICKLASSRNWTVRSLSRHGEPHWPSPTSTSIATSARPDWADKVDWRKGDVLNPDTYRDAIKGADAVVHSLGILLEADYKGVLQGKEPVLKGLMKAFDSARATGRNTIREGGKGLSYETMNRDSAVTLAEEAARTGTVKSFLYVSAIDSFFALPKRYITTKREAEERISGIAQDAGMRSVYLRPSFLYDSSRTFTLPLAAATMVTSTVNNMFMNKLPLLGAAGYKPLAVERVAASAVKALEDESVSGVVDVEGISRLADKVWREGML